MRNKYMQRAGVLMAAALMVTMIAPSGSMADDSVVEIRRQDVGQIALDYSPVVKGLELNRMNLSQSYLDLVDQMSFLEQAYDGLDDYAGLYDFYNGMSPNYQGWLTVSVAAAGDTTNAALTLLLAEMTDGDFLPSDPTNPADGPDSNTLTGTDEVTLKAEIDTGMMMPIDVYKLLTH